MNENSAFDYTVAKKVEGKYLLHRILMIVGYVLLGSAYFFGLFLAHFYPLMAFVVLIVWITVFFTWRYVSIEYRYETESGMIRFYTVYGGKKKKLVLEKRIKEFIEISKCSEENLSRISAVEYNNVYRLVRSESFGPDDYFATFEHNGKNCIVYFEANEQALKILKFYNSSAR